jgi:RNA polymerase sigma-70 factor (ECF subfamily)
VITPKDEVGCIERSRAGDADAFRVVIERYQRMVHHLAYRMTGSFADAEDIAQETFVRAYRHLDGYRGEARVSSWLVRITMNLCLNWTKGEARRSRLHRRWAEERSTHLDCDLNQDAQTQELRRRVEQALLRLPAKQRAALVLTVYEGMTHGEAARLLRCSEATVSWRVFAARTKLKRWLK